jgi:hypothetical protein
MVKRFGLLSFLGVAYSLFTIQAGASAPTYLFKLKDNFQPDLCTHMEAVFNDHFKQIWAIPIPTDEKLSIYDSQSQYAFPLLPGTTHSNAMTNAMMHSRIPTSPEFQAIRWIEGHASAGGNIMDGRGKPAIFPFLIAYFDIDNDGVEDTVIKTMFTKGYNAIVAAGESGDVGENISVYHDKKVMPTANTTITEMATGSEIFGKPGLIVGPLVRPLIFGGKSYVASYGQGLFGKPTKQSRFNVRAGRPPMERMFISSYSSAAASHSVNSTYLPVTTLCVYDMIQNEGSETK